MSDRFSMPGFAPDGTPFAVQARVRPDRGRGALLGQAIGDALGTTLEFTQPAVANLPALLDGPHTTITGEGPFGLIPGQVTDDTQMACALARSLMVKGRFDAADVAARYVAWSQDAFDIGNQTSEALGRVRRGDSPSAAGRAVWEGRRRQPAGNGALMRVVPIGLFFSQFHEDRIRAALDDAAITHFDPRCQLASAAFAGAVAVGVFEGAGPRAMAARAVHDLDRASEILAERHPDLLEVIRQAALDLRADVRAAMSEHPDVYSEQVHLLAHMGFVRVAFRLAFWHLLHTDDPSVALIDVVNRGGDSDTNGAITGALLGAAHGESAWPQPWVDAVLGAEPLPPWNGELHPRSLLELVHPG